MNRVLEQRWIQGVIDRKAMVDVRISNGYGFRGKIVDQDDVVILLKEEKDGKTTYRLQYKRDISNIIPL